MTSISEALAAGWDASDLTRSYQLLCNLLQTRDIKIQICRLHGRRWSAFLSNHPMVMALHRSELSPEWGIIYEDTRLEELLPFLRGLPGIS